MPGGGLGQAEPARQLVRALAGGADGSADLHNISGGTFDARTGQNVPAHIAGQRVADRLSFHFRSAYYFGHGARFCADIRAGCPAAAGTGRRGCLARRAPIGPRNIGRVRLGLISDSDARVAIWAAGREGELFERAFGRGLEVG